MSNINPLFAQLALDWLEAERHAAPDKWPVVPQRDHMTIAIDRVYQVITGNVLRSEASPGDLAIWKSRVEDVPMFARTWTRGGKAVPPEEQKEPTDDPYNHVTPRPPRPARTKRQYSVWWNYYDTARIDQNGIDGLSMSERLFTSRNVGQGFRTNLQVPGQITPDASFTVGSFYVAISSLDALHWAGDRMMFQFVVGESLRYAPPLFMRDLFRGIVLPKPFVLAVRQNFHCNVSLRERYPADAPPFEVTFHFEGYESRTVY